MINDYKVNNLDMFIRFIDGNCHNEKLMILFRNKTNNIINEKLYTQKYTLYDFVKKLKNIKFEEGYDRLYAVFKPHNFTLIDLDDLQYLDEIKNEFYDVGYIFDSVNGKHIILRSITDWEINYLNERNIHFWNVSNTRNLSLTIYSI